MPNIVLPPETIFTESENRYNAFLMNILFDVSRFGTAWIDGTKRDIRGIYRVVWDLATALAEQDDINLHLTSMSHRKLWGAARIAVRHTPHNALPFLPVFRAPGVSYAYAILVRAMKTSGRIRKKLTIRSGSTSQTAREVAGNDLFPPWQSPPIGIDQSRLADIDLIHLPFFIMPSLPKLKPSIVTTIHDLIPLVTRTDHSALRPFLEEKVREIRPEHWVHCISESTRMDLLSYAPHLDPERVFVVPNGVSPTFFREDDRERVDAVLLRYGLQPAARYVVSLSTMQERKNLKTALKAFSLIKSEYPDLKYVLIGYQFPESLQRIKEIIAELHLHDRVVLTGHIPDSDVRAFYSGAQTFVFPSLYEGFGLPPLEAMTCGLPVISSNSSSLPEVIDDAGVLVDPMDVDGFAAAMRRVLDDSSLASELSARSIQRSRLFTWKSTAEQLANRYRSILESER